MKCYKIFKMLIRLIDNDASRPHNDSCREEAKIHIVPQVGYIRYAIFQALDNICTKRFMLKEIIQNNPTLDRA